MLNNSPLFLLLVLLICTIIIIKKCIVEHKFYKELLITSLVLIFAYTMIIVFYDNIKNNEISYTIYKYSSLFVLLIVGIFFYSLANTNLNKKAFLNNILHSLEDNTLYLLLNKKNKVIEVSSFLANKFGVDKEEIINKNIECLLNNYITIETINNKNVSNNEFLQYINTSIPKNLNSNLDIKYLKKDGKEDTVTITESAIYTGDSFYGRMYLGLIKPQETTKAITIDKKFNSIVKTVNEGILSYSFITKTLYINDNLVESLELVGNTLSLSDVLYNISETDYNNLETLIQNSRRENPYINTVLRYTFKNGTQIFLKLALEVLFDGLNKTEVVGSVLLSNNKQFINLNSSVLDDMKLEDNINYDIKNLVNNETKFEVVTFKILDIKEINNKYSRKVGTLIIEEYIRSLINVFELKNNIYRVSGTRFVFILTDPRQMEKLTRAVTNNKLLTPTLNYGSVNIKLNVIMGLSFSNDSIRKDEIYTNSKYALKKCMEQKKQYLFYRDLLE